MDDQARILEKCVSWHLPLFVFTGGQKHILQLLFFITSYYLSLHASIDRTRVQVKSHVELLRLQLCLDWPVSRGGQSRAQCSLMMVKGVSGTWPWGDSQGAVQPPRCPCQLRMQTSWLWCGNRGWFHGAITVTFIFIQLEFYVTLISQMLINIHIKECIKAHILNPHPQVGDSNCGKRGNNCSNFFLLKRGIVRESS